MNPTIVGILCGAVVAVTAIAAATVGVVLGSIDGASFSAIIGSAVTGGAVAGANAINSGNGRRLEKKNNGPNVV